MKNTNTNEMNAKVRNYLLPIVEQKAENYEMKIEGNPFAWLVGIARNEVPHEFARHGAQEGLKQWLMGCSIDIDIYYSDIIARAEEWHECKLSDKEKEKVCDNWFKFIAFKIIQFSEEPLKNYKGRI